MSTTAPTDISVEPNTKDLKKIFNGDNELMMFFNEWWKAGRNSTKAYSELHKGEYDLTNPDDYAVCATLGSRLFKKVDIFQVLVMYGMGPERYFKQLDDGLSAMKSDMTGQTYPDHKTRKDYHDKLGRLLGIETANNVINVQNNNFISLD